MNDQQPDNIKKIVSNIIDRQEKLKSGRMVWETHWQECMDYIVPRKNDVISTRTPGSKRGADLFDTTAIASNENLAGGLHGMLTSPSIRFFDLMFGDPKIDGDETVKRWLQEVADRMYIVMNNSNFQTEVHEIYIDLGAIGTACMYIGEHEENVVHFSARPMKEIYVDENNLGLIDTVNRVFHWKARQIVQEFGEDKVPDFVLKKYKDGAQDSFEVIHSVYPNEGQSVLKFKSCYVLVEKKFLLSEGGFREFPYAVPRWTKTSGEIYGRGPGMDMLPDIKMVNKMMETTLKGAQKTVDPPLMVSDDGVIGNVRLTPGGLTVVRPSSDIPIRPIITDARVDFGMQVVENVRNRVRGGFYFDQLQMREGPQMTATEVMQRTEERLRLMGPVLGRQHFEFLRPTIERLFGIMVRRGMIPNAPHSIQGKKFDVKYSSVVARAQRMSEGQNLTRAISLIAPVMQADPSVFDNINGDEALKYSMDIYGVPQKILRTSKEVKDKRDQRAQAQQQQMKAMQEQHQAEIASKVGPAAAQLSQAQTAQQKLGPQGG